MGMATGHMDLMDDILLPLLVTAASPDPWPLSTPKCMDMCTAQQLRSHIAQTLAKETTGRDHSQQE